MNFNDDRKSQTGSRGFTLIELIVVIVILGVLAATAMPKFVNLRRDARIAALSGVEGGLRGAMTLAQGAYYAKARSTLSSSSDTGTFQTQVELNDGSTTPFIAYVWPVNKVPYFLGHSNAYASSDLTLPAVNAMIALMRCTPPSGLNTVEISCNGFKIKRNGGHQAEDGRFYARWYLDNEQCSVTYEPSLSPLVLLKVDGGC